MPRWHRRLTQHYEQVANDVQIWKAFRRRDRFVEIATDGGLSNDVGTFGWKIVTVLPNQTDVTLFKGSGFIDGPTEVGSSTRSELGGFTAPLMVATALARFWGIRHKCQFRWYTDSKSAISKVRMFSTKGKPRHYPDNSDYVMVIQELLRELKQPLTPLWVKGHQDEERPYNELSREAKLNVDVDELATNHTHHHTTAKPMRRIDHLPCQLISLKINGQRFPSHWDTNLRWTINGSYMKNYVKEKHGWDEATWNTIDFGFVKDYCTSAKSGTKYKWFKFMHNLQSVGERNQKMNRSAAEVNISLCPCCYQQTETQQHMILCELNPKRPEALRELSTGGSSYKENHNFTMAMTDCIEQWLYDTTRSPSIATSNNPAIYDRQDPILPPHMQNILHEAIHEQYTIGWMNLFRGYISSKWFKLAASHMVNAEAPLQPSEGRRRLGVILQRIQLFVNHVWTGRNDMLHRRNKDEEARFLSLEAAEIRHYFTQPHLLPVHTQHYCTGSVLHILRSSPANRRRWLRRVRRARADLITNQLRQARITSYFTRKHKDATSNDMASRPPADTARDSRQYTERRIPTPAHQQLARKSQQQTRIYHFFPGRPPENRDPDQTVSTKSFASK